MRDGPIPCRIIFQMLVRKRHDKIPAISTQIEHRFRPFEICLCDDLPSQHPPDALLMLSHVYQLNKV